MGYKYASAEEAAEARRRYMREYNRLNSHKYKDKARARARQRYRTDEDFRARTIAAGCARYAADPAPTKARNRANYPTIKALVGDRSAQIKRVFELLHEHQREEYAQWLLFLAGTDSYTSLAVRAGSVDSTYMGRYAGI
ncbi:hypothetical protein [Ensifer sp. YR511]|uniref:hypothetical protein n=1 Tax=Ensifer sp. YR511 TaxID=1855294 RepID=UPI00088B01FE|nr:hypothetical protein [Ensifer sp. YR511]SDM28719.1 hypothetical protein SAMN05216328_107287 [Ensifer sp. YR511]